MTLEQAQRMLAPLSQKTVWRLRIVVAAAIIFFLGSGIGAGLWLQTIAAPLVLAMSFVKLTPHQRRQVLLPQRTHPPAS
jgi:hypothetical protein